MGRGGSGANDAEQEYRELITLWRPQTRVWALAHGHTISTICVAASSYTILLRMRLFFNLFSQQHLFATIIPVVALPSMGYVISQDLFVGRKLARTFALPEMHTSICSTCLQIRGSFIQVAAGVVAPIIFSFFSCGAAALSYRTFPVPDLNRYRKVIGVARRACGSFSYILFLLSLGNMMVGEYVTEKMLEQHVVVCTTEKTGYLKK